MTSQYMYHTNQVNTNIIINIITSVFISVGPYPYPTIGQH